MRYYEMIKRLIKKREASPLFFYGESGEYMKIRARPKGLIFVFKFKKRKENVWKQLFQPASQQA